MNVAETKKWMEQWRAAGVALEAVRAEELGRLDEFQNAAIASSFFSPENRTMEGRETSGLVEQQAIFLRALTR
jgi:hypothetical protein